MTVPAARMAAVVLAAGEGKRLKSSLPKVLHEIAGVPMVNHAVRVARALDPEHVVVVCSPARETFEKALEGHDVVLAVQEPPRGTGDAVRIGLEAFPSEVDVVLVTLGDSPLISSDTLQRLLEEQVSLGAAAVLLTAERDGMSDWGRVIRSETGEVARIVEARDASLEELEILEVNAGFYAFDARQLRSCLARLAPENSQNEYYLTDVVEMLHDAGERVRAVTVPLEETLGVNDRVQMAAVAQIFRRRIVEDWMRAGVAIVDPSSTFIDASVVLEPGATVLPFTFLEGETHIAAGATVGPQVRIVDSSVGEGAEVTFAVVRRSEVGPEASVGPFASLRPGTKLARGAKLGTFVESKNSTLGEDSKANHLAYLGDATIGRGVNVGAGTITCNWDGREKHETVIDDDAYIGSDTMLVAPVHIGERGATGAGAVVRGEVPPDSLAVGVPARIIEGKGDKMERDPKERGSAE